MQMMRRYQILSALFIVALFFIFGDAHTPTLHAQGPERVEVVIRNFAYEVQGGDASPRSPSHDYPSAAG